MRCTALLFVAVALLSVAAYSYQVEPNQQFMTVTDAEADLVRGGADCVDVGNVTCGEGENEDEDCSAATCLIVADENIEVTKENQKVLSTTVCGVSSCFSVSITSNCTQ